jgi:hypothetical protein
MKTAVLLAMVSAAIWTASAQYSGTDSAGQRADSTDWRAVDQAMGRSGKPQPDGSYKYSLPRSDLKVTAHGVAVKPALEARGSHSDRSETRQWQWAISSSLKTRSRR